MKQTKESPLSVKVVKGILLTIGLIILFKSGLFNESYPEINNKECNIGTLLCLVALFKRIRLDVKDMFNI